MIKNRLILTGIFIEMGVIEIEYELNKINVFTKSDEEPCKVNHLFRSTLLRNTHLISNWKMNIFFSFNFTIFRSVDT